MIRRFALWLAVVSDSWARRLAGDTTADQLAAAGELDAFQVDCGTLITHTPLAVLFELDELRARRAARKRHPAGSAR